MKVTEYHRFRSAGAEDRMRFEELVLIVEPGGRALLKRAPETPPHRFREVLVLRGMKLCSYKEITITSIPSGTVMSALSRARRQLQLALAKDAAREAY